MDRRKPPQSGLKRYFALYSHLLHELQTGAYAEPGCFPSELALVREQGLSRNTVRRALERLEREGWIERRKGGRTVVRAPLATEVVHAQVDGTSTALEDLARATTTRTLAFQRIAAPSHLRARDPTLGSEVLKIVRVRSVGRQPFACLTSYLPEWLIPHVRRTALGTRPLRLYLESLGFVSARGRQVTAGVAATLEHAHALAVEIGTPLTAVRRWVYDTADRLLEFQDFLYHPGRYEIGMDVEFVRTTGGGGRWVTRQTRNAVVRISPRDRPPRRGSQA